MSLDDTTDGRRFKNAAIKSHLGHGIVDSSRTIALRIKKFFYCVRYSDIVKVCLMTQQKETPMPRRGK